MCCKRIYLHIGWEKTGSSSLQVFLRKNQAWLQAHGYLYPSLGTLPQHIEIYRALSQPLPQKRYEMIHRIRRVLADTQCENVIFSHESLHVCDPALFREMFDGHDVQIIAYLRRYDEALLSHFATMVRWGLIRVSPSATLLLRYSRRYLAGFDYVWPLLDFAATFRHENIHPIIYNEALLKREGLISNFLSLIGLNETHGAFWPKANANISLTAAELAFVLRAAEAIDSKTKFLAPRHTRKLASALLAARPRCGHVSIVESLPLASKQRLIELFESSSELLSQGFFGGEPVFDPVQTSSDFKGPTHDEVQRMKDVVAAAPNLSKVIKTEISRSL